MGEISFEGCISAVFKKKRFNQERKKRKKKNSPKCGKSEFFAMLLTTAGNMCLFIMTPVFP